MAAGLAAMAIRFTASRREFEARREELEAAAARCDELATRALKAVDEDVSAYGRVAAAYRLPKSTPAEKAERSDAIQTGLRGAMLVPLQIAELGIEVLETLDPLVDGCNPNLVADLAGGVDAAIAGVRSGLRNVDANLRSMKDETEVAAAWTRVRKVLDALTHHRERFAKFIEKDWPTA